MKLLCKAAKLSDDSRGGNSGQQSEPNQGINLEADLLKIRIGLPNDLIKPGDFMPNLGTNATNQEVAIRRKLNEDYRWTPLELTVGLLDTR